MAFYVARADNATKGIPLEALPDEAWRYLTGGGDAAGSMSGIAAYQRVAWVYRAVRIRANKLAGLPYKLTRIDDPETDLALLSEYAPLMYRLRGLIGRNEASLCIYGASYNIVEANRYGFNKTLRWLLPPTIQPIISPETGLEGFNRATTQGHMKLQPFDPKSAKPGEIVYYWEPNIAGEEGPGQSVVSAALRAAAALDNMDTAIASFFERGMIRATILTVDGNPAPAEMSKLESWWKRLFSGVSNAWNTAAFRAQVKPQVIGDGIGELSNRELSEQEQQAIIATVGVPMSLILSNAANYATAQQDAIAMYTNTVLPQWDQVHAATLNEFLSIDGLTMTVDQNRIEEMQSRQLQQAEQITKLVGQPVMLVDEGRAWLGLAPLERAITQTAEAAPAAEAPEVEQRSSESVTIGDTEIRADLERWRTKALKRLREGKSAQASFVSTTIPPELSVAIYAALGHATTSDAVRSVYSAHLRAIGDLTPEEQRIYRAILPILRSSVEPAAQAIIAGGTFDLSMLSAELQAALLPVLTRIFAARLADDMGTGVELATSVINQTALAWAQTYTYDLVTGLNETTQAALRDAFATFNNTPGMTRQQLEALLEPTFGQVRASMIAVTETTRTASSAVAERQRYLAASGIDMIRYWSTSGDELVCEICGPLNGKSEAEWRGGPPPAHVNCRCSTVLRLAGQ